MPRKIRQEIDEDLTGEHNLLIHLQSGFVFQSWFSRRRSFQLLFTPHQRLQTSWFSYAVALSIFPQFRRTHQNCVQEV